MWHYQVGDRIVYRITRHSVQPERDALLVVPARNGDDYCCCVDKYWIVDAVDDGGTLIARSRHGKLHRLNSDDPSLRHATLLESIFQRSRFPSLNVIPQGAAPLPKPRG